MSKNLEHFIPGKWYSILPIYETIEYSAHRANCGTLNHTRCGYEEMDKACSDSREELDQWVVAELAAVATPCGHC